MNCEGQVLVAFTRNAIISIFARCSRQFCSHGRVIVSEWNRYSRSGMEHRRYGSFLPLGLCRKFSTGKHLWCPSRNRLPQALGSKGFARYASFDFFRFDARSVRFSETLACIFSRKCKFVEARGSSRDSSGTFLRGRVKSTKWTPPRYLSAPESIARKVENSSRRSYARRNLYHRDEKLTLISRSHLARQEVNSVPRVVDQNLAGHRSFH